MKRRSFLGAAVASPFAAKSAAAKAAADGVAMEAMGLGNLSYLFARESVPASVSGTSPSTIALAAVREYLKINGLPRHKKDEIEHIARTDRGYIDPDVAVLRSVSPTVKARLQRDRVRARAEAQVMFGLDYNIERRAFNEAMEKLVGYPIEWF